MVHEVNYIFPLRKCPYCGEKPEVLWGAETNNYYICCNHPYCKEQPAIAPTSNWLKARLLWDRQKVYKESDFEN